MKQRLVILNVVGLAPRHFDRPELIPNLAALARRGGLRPLQPSFPAVTSSVQATLLTGQPPSVHGIVGNGWFDRDNFEVKFWDQPAALVQSPRLWDQWPDCKTAVLFWQNSLFIQADIVVTPRPLHTDSGLVQWCYSKPAGYYEKLQAEIGGFKLQDYWGPVVGGMLCKSDKPSIIIIIIIYANTRTQMINIKPRRLEITTWLPNNNSILHDAGDQDRD